MTIWQRRARLVIGVAALAFAGLVATQFSSRNPQAPSLPVERADPTATIESTRGEFSRVNQEQEKVRFKYEKLLGYSDGSRKLLGVTVITERAEGRTFTMTAKEGKSGKSETDFEMTGDVRLTADDGLDLRTEHATYTDADGMVRADGLVTFSRGQTSGSGVGMTYDKNRDLLVLLDKAALSLPPDAGRKARTDVTSGGASFTRPEHVVQFERNVRIQGEFDVTEASNATARLSADEQRIEGLELRGNSRLTGTRATPGAFRSVSGQDIDLKYREGGQIERAMVTGGAVIDVAGEKDQGNRRIEASAIDIGLGADGSTPTALTARERVKLTIPPDVKSDPARTISADSMDAKGTDRQGLTSARFTGNVEFTERGSRSPRTAHAASLDVDMSKGLGTIDEARFSKSVRFTEDALTASAASARYVLARGSLELTGTEAGATPRVQNERIDIGATRIDLTFDGPVVHAAGNVGSTLRPAKRGSPSATKAEPKTPSLLKSDQEVQVSAADLTYDGQASKATYTGGSKLWQGDTKINGGTIEIDDKTGNLTVRGGATTTSMVLQEGKDKKKERVQSRGAGKEFKYDESQRRGTYTGDATLVDAQGDLAASVIDLYLQASGDEFDRVEAREAVRITLLEKHRTVTGDDLKYFTDDGRYEVKGKPVTIIDECGRKNDGLTLTFFRSTDRIILNGNPTNLTQTRSDGSSCR